MNRIYKPVSCLGLTQGGDMLARAIHANPWMMQDLQPHERWAMESLDALGVVRELKRIFPLLRVVDTFPYPVWGQPPHESEAQSVQTHWATLGGRGRVALTFTSRIQHEANCVVVKYVTDVANTIMDFTRSGLWEFRDSCEFTDWAEFAHQTKGV